MPLACNFLILIRKTAFYLHSSAPFVLEPYHSVYSEYLRAVGEAEHFFADPEIYTRDKLLHIEISAVYSHFCALANRCGAGCSGIFTRGVHKSGLEPSGRVLYYRYALLRVEHLHTRIGGSGTFA